MRDILSKTVEQGTAKRAKIEGYEILENRDSQLLVNGRYLQTIIFILLRPY